MTLKTLDEITDKHKELSKYFDSYLRKAMPDEMKDVEFKFKPMDESLEMVSVVELRQSAIAWIKNFLMAYHLNPIQLPNNFILDKNNGYELFGFELDKSVSASQMPGLHMIAILMYVNNITKEDLK